MSALSQTLGLSESSGGGRRGARRGGRRTVRRGGRRTARRGGRRTVRRGGRRTPKRGGRFGVPAVLFLSQKAVQHALHGKGKGKRGKRGKRSRSTILGKVSRKFNKYI
jgi:hypothetical protein